MQTILRIMYKGAKKCWKSFSLFKWTRNIALLLPISMQATSVLSLYLTWYDDPTTTMSIHWHTSQKVTNDQLFYREKGTAEWQFIYGTHEPIPHSKRFIHTVHLNQLQPDTLYEFRIDEQLYTFKTLPENPPVKFICGGDLYGFKSTFKHMNNLAISKEPDFIVLGGDLAYSAGFYRYFLFSSEVDRWFSFLDEWSKMITPSGRVIPTLFSLGNHDIYPENKELFFTLFPQKRSYFSLSLGNYLQLIVLDTGYIASIEEQASWLKQTLAKPHTYKFAIYHEPAYPSVSAYDNSTSTLIRKHWSPLFENSGVQAAFEHHNHCYKRTFPIKAEAIDPKGTFYLGDGCWGVIARRPQKAWYLNHARKKHNFFLIELEKTECKISAIDSKDRIFDQVEISTQ